MILIDTNIISEMMKPAPDAKVITWIDQQDIMHLYISTITIAELAYGINALPAGNRRNYLEKAFNSVVREAFEYRIFTFDEVAAHQYGIIMSQRKNIGKPMSMADGQIAAIAQAHNCTIATRNTNDFANSNLDLVNPFL
ncbi:MAG: type II toxin-antitoxin system VapC family toxin [Pseudomonadota bacterium]|nr:type II toxin-antitoxin system VapC family toxin [Pseudomonadota bacterium]